MTFRRSLIFDLASVSLLLVPSRARAQGAHVVVYTACGMTPREVGSARWTSS